MATASPFTGHRSLSVLQLAARSHLRMLKSSRACAPQRRQGSTAGRPRTQGRYALAAPRRAGPVSCQATGASEPLVAVEGDIVTIHFTCKDMEGNVLESTRNAEEPLTFEIGSGDITRNRLFEAFDTAVRGLGVGDTTTLEAQGGEWKRELLFKMPCTHPEVERLQGRYKNQGGVTQGLVVELANGGLAVVLEVTEEHVVLDANNMMAGKNLQFDLEVVSIERGT